MRTPGITRDTADPETAPVLGLRQNFARSSLLVLVNAFVGGMVGFYGAILPLIFEREFGLVSKSVILPFIVGFGFVKAFTNLAAGRFSDRIGRKGLLVEGWIVGLARSDSTAQRSATSKPGGLKKSGGIEWFYGSFDLR